MSAAGCAIVIAAAVAVPQLLSAGSPGGKAGPPVAASQSPPSLQPSQSQSLSGSSTSAPLVKHDVQLAQRTHLTGGITVTVPPPNFRPTTVTFVGTGTGSVVGAVLGQAGTPGHCATADCTSLAGTSDYGQHWYGVSAPVTPGPDGGSGVSQLRFTSLKDGWAFGP